jgi:hypothetical protein
MIRQKLQLQINHISRRQLTQISLIPVNHSSAARNAPNGGAKFTQMPWRNMTQSNLRLASIAYTED